MAASVTFRTTPFFVKTTSRSLPASQPASRKGSGILCELESELPLGLKIRIMEALQRHGLYLQMIQRSARGASPDLVFLESLSTEERRKAFKLFSENPTPKNVVFSDLPEEDANARPIYGDQLLENEEAVEDGMDEDPQMRFLSSLMTRYFSNRDPLTPDQ